MTKKHFIALADAIRPIVDQEENGLIVISKDELMEALTGFCARQNPNFMPDRWVNYVDGKCGKNGGKVKQSVTV